MTYRPAPNEVSVVESGVLDLPGTPVNGVTNTVIATTSSVTVNATNSLPIYWGAYTSDVGFLFSILVPAGTGITFTYLDDVGGWVVTATSLASVYSIGNNFSTAGQMIVGSGADTATILDPGTDGQYLVADSAQPAGLNWYTIPTPLAPLTDNPAAMMQPSAQTVISTGTWTKVGSMVSIYAVGGMTVSGSSVTVPTTGIYRAVYQIKWQNSGSTPPAGPYSAGVLKGSGAGTRLSESGVTNVTSQFPYCGGTIDVSLAAGDVLSLGGIQATGVSQGTAYNGFGASNPCTWLSVSLVSQ